MLRRASKLCCKSMCHLKKLYDALISSTLCKTRFRDQFLVFGVEIFLAPLLKFHSKFAILEGVYVMLFFN